MKKKFTLSLVCIVLTVFFSYGQILTLVEKQNGRSETIALDGAKIIDINSTIEISISKEELIEKIKVIHPEFGDQLELQGRIDALSRVLDNQEMTLSLLKQETLNKSDKEELYKGLKSFYANLLQQGNEDLRGQVGVLFQEWRQQYGRNSINSNSGVKKEVYIYSNLNSDLNEVKNELKNYEGESFMISMLAFVHSDLGKSKVHIENFDIIAESDIYTVPRWVTSLSEDQQKQLKELQKRAEDYNKEALQYFNNLKAELLSKLPDLSCIKRLKEEIEAFILDSNLSDNIKSALRSDANAIIDEIDGFNELLGFVTQDISSWSIETPFKIIDNVKLLVNDIKNLNAVFDKFTNTAGAFDVIKIKINELRGDFGSCYRSISSDIDGLTTGMSIP